MNGQAPLAGLRVVDCSSGTAGPRATGILADYGADVVWIEPPGGDVRRGSLRIPYSVFNRGKRSRTLDLKDPADAERLRELLRRADVFVHSWRPGTAERLGLGFDAMHETCPGLIYCAVSGFGADGRLCDVPGYESLVHALVGTMAEQVGFRAGPIYEALPFASTGAAYLAVIGMLSAIYRRRQDGHGRAVETSLYDGAVAFMMSWDDRDRRPAQFNPGAVGIKRAVMRNLLCQDERYLGVHTGAVRAFNRVMAALAPGQVFDEPQPRHNGIIVTVDDPELGPVEQVGPALRFGDGLAPTPAGPPPAGQHDGSEIFPAAPSRWYQPVTGGPDRRPLLAGVRVIDLGAYYAGPYASRLLADVVKVEPLAGDPLRGNDTVFNSAQAGKRALSADLKTAAGRAMITELITRADVVHHNMRPGAAERLGVGYADARGINPRLVYLHAPGWGVDGPYAHRQSFAPLLSTYVGAGFEVAGQFNPPLHPAGNEDSAGRTARPAGAGRQCPRPAVRDRRRLARAGGRERPARPRPRPGPGRRHPVRPALFDPARPG